MKKEDLSKRIDQIWDSINRNSIGYLDVHFIDISSELTQFLIVSLFNDDTFEIGTFCEDKIHGSIVSYDIYNSDKELNLKMNSDLSIDIELCIDDWDDERKIYRHKLTDDQLNIIPNGLINLMREVMLTDTERTIRKNSIKK